LGPDELRAALRGVIAFAPTPFTPDDEVDLDGLGAIVDDLARLGGPVAVCGAVGEYAALDLSEYHAVIRVAAQATGGRVPLIVGVGHGTRIAAALAELAARVGASGILVVPFTFSEPPDDGVVEHYRGLASASGLGLVCFSTTGQPYPLERLLRLAELDAVVGFKEEMGDVGLFAEARRRIGARWAWINGMAELHVERYAALGADAFTSGLVNIAPELTRAVHDGAAAGRWDEVAQAVEIIRPFAALRARRPGYSVAVIKEAMAMLGKPGGGRVRPPLVRMRAEDRDELRAVLSSLGVAAVA
jgi:5-dehydro-4-deoxyglucarate dehydratase